MNKRKIKKELMTHYNIKNTKNKFYDFLMENKNQTYAVKIIKTRKTTLLTFNSNKVLEIAQGTLDGLKYKKKSYELLSLDYSDEYQNKILLCTEKPYKILKYLNESDIEDVSAAKIVHHFFVCDTLSEVAKIVN